MCYNQRGLNGKCSNGVYICSPLFTGPDCNTTHVFDPCYSSPCVNGNCTYIYHPMYSHAAVSQDTLEQHVIQRLIIVKELIVVMEPVSIHQPLVIHVSVRMGTPETIALLISMTVILIHVLMVYAMMLWLDTLAVASMIGLELIVMLR